MASQHHRARGHSHTVDGQANMIIIFVGISYPKLWCVFSLLADILVPEKQVGR